MEYEITPLKTKGLKKSWSELRNCLKAEIFEFLPLSQIITSISVLSKDFSNTIKKNNFFIKFRENFSDIISNFNFDDESHLEIKKILNVKNQKRLEDILRYLVLKIYKEKLELKISRSNKANIELITFLISNNKSMRSLELNHFNLDYLSSQNSIQAIANLSKSIEKNTTITKFKLNKFSLSDASMRIIVEGVGKNKSISELSLENCKITNQGLIRISNIIFYNKPITNLNLNGNDFDTFGVSFLLKFILQSNTLQVLNLSYISVNTEQIKIISEFLKKTTSLKEFYYSSNYIQNEGMKIIADSLNINKSLNLIDFSNNFIRNEGVIYLFDTLKSNQNICEIKIQLNQFDDIGAKAIFECLMENQNIRFIDAQNNHISYNVELPNDECILGKIIF